MARKLAFALVAAFFLYGCGSSEVGKDDQNRESQLELLSHLGNELILPAYENFAVEASSLVDDIEALELEKSEANLAAVKAQWLEAYTSWQKAGFYFFGPAISNGIIGVNLYPTDKALVDQYISTGEYNLGTAGSNFAKGFPALDYVLYGYTATDTELLNQLETDPNLIAYLKAVAIDIETLAIAVRDQWSPAGSDYLGVFITNPGTSAGSSLSQLVNGWAQYMELHIRNAKVGTPNGNSVVSAERFGPFPEKAEAYYSENNSIHLLRTAVEAIRDFYEGMSADAVDGMRLRDYLEVINAQNGTLAGDYRLSLDQTLQEIDDLNESLSNEIINNGAAVTEIFNALKTNVALLKVDLVSALSISINYADNDGD